MTYKIYSAVFMLLFSNICLAFSYQGELSVSGVPYNGNADFRFTLYDDANAGSIIGVNDQHNNQSIVNGRFVIDLDLWTSEFDGRDFWLEIAVSAPSGNGLLVLANRQKISPTPYADYAFDGSSSSNITSIFGGTGLSGGGSSGNVTLSVNTNVIQRRVTGACTFGQFVDSIRADGSVTCSEDPSDGVTSLASTPAGGIRITSPSGPVPELSIRSDSVTGAHIKGSSIAMDGDVVEIDPVGVGVTELYLISDKDATINETATCLVTASGIFHFLDSGDADGIGLSIAVRRTDDSTGLFAENPAGVPSTIFMPGSFNAGLTGFSNRAMSALKISVNSGFRYQFGCYFNGIAPSIQDDLAECTVTWICL